MCRLGIKLVRWDAQFDFLCLIHDQCLIRLYSSFWVIFHYHDMIRILLQIDLSIIIRRKHRR